MSTKIETKQIGSHTYSVKQWDATKAMVMKIRLAKYFGGIFEALSGKNESIEQALLSNLGKILDGVDEVEFIEFIKEVACAATIDGSRMNKSLFDSYFTGDLTEPYKVAFFVVKVNYEDFLASILNSSVEK